MNLFNQNSDTFYSFILRPYHEANSFTIAKSAPSRFLSVLSLSKNILISFPLNLGYRLNQQSDPGLTEVCSVAKLYFVSHRTLLFNTLQRCITYTLSSS